MSKRWLTAAAAALALWMPAAAQVSTGTITGRVVDPQQAAVGDAKVTVTNTATGVSRTTATNEAGLYLVPLLQPGTYAVAVEATGFKKANRIGVPLRVADQLAVDFQVDLGALAETVTVEGAAPLVNTTGNTLGQVIENRRIVDLPLNGREPFSLAYLAPGVLPPPQPPGAFVHLGGSVPSISGASNFTSEVTIDGMPNTTPRNNGRNSFLIYTPSVDSVEEFKVQTNSLSAEYGRFNGGVISVVTKSGTNQFHGVVYEFLRNSYFDANNFFNNRAGIPLGSLRRNQFGATVGGPVILPKLYNGRNRTFFFFSYEGFREASLNPASFTVPTVEQRRGDFSRTLAANGRLIEIFDPLTSNNPNQARSPFPGNVIPQNRISPIATRWGQFYPAPTNTRLVGNLDLSAARNNRTDTYESRIDQNWSDRNRMFVRASVQNPYVGEPNFFGNIANPGLPPLTQYRRAGTLQDTFTVSPTLILNVNYGVIHMYGRRIAWSNEVDPTTLGLPSSFSQAQQFTMLPTATITGMTGLGDTQNAYSTQMSHTLQTSATKIAGKHALKAGWDYRVYLINQLQNTRGMGNFSFGTNFTQGPNPNQASANAGFGYATFLLGIPSGSLALEPGVASKNAYSAIFLQDDWKVHPRLTLNLGIRYEVNYPRVERFDRMSVFDLDAPSPLTGRVPGFPALRGSMGFRGPEDRRLWIPDRDNFAPRFGFAWQALRDFTVRGGYGVFYGLSPTDASGAGAGFTDGFAAATTIIASLDGTTPVSSLANPFPDGVLRPQTRSELGPGLLLGQSHNSAPLSMVTPYFQQWNVSLQKGLGANLLLEVAYAGNKGNNTTLGSLNINSLTADQIAAGTVNQQLVANPFAGLITDPTSILSRPTVQRGQLLRPYPQYINVIGINPAIGNMIFHSLQSKVEKRFSRGFSVLGSYTIGKNINDTQQDAIGPGTGVQDPTNLRLERSLDPQDVSQRLVMSGVYELPIGRGRLLGAGWGKVADSLLGGWQVNAIASFQTGLPLAMGSTGAARPNRIATGDRIEGRVQDRLLRYFDTSAFAVPAAFTYGNSSRTAPDLRAPGIANYDLSLFKTFALHERARLQFRFESFNAFNRVQFAAPGTTAGTPAFGTITQQQNTPRQLQFALKLIY